MKNSATRPVPSPRKPFSIPRLRRLGTLRHLTRIKLGTGNDGIGAHGSKG